MSKRLGSRKPIGSIELRRAARRCTMFTPGITGGRRRPADGVRGSGGPDGSGGLEEYARPRHSGACGRLAHHGVHRVRPRTQPVPGRWLAVARPRAGREWPGRVRSRGALGRACGPCRRPAAAIPINGSLLSPSVHDVLAAEVLQHGMNDKRPDPVAAAGFDRCEERCRVMRLGIGGLDEQGIA